MQRVLIICYYWPPAGGPGVQRWLKFVKYFRDFQIEPVVYIPENPHYPIIDDSLHIDIPQNIEIIKQPIKEPYKLANLLSKRSTKQMSKGIIDSKPSIIKKILLKIRGNYFIPDARVGWVGPSVNYLSKYLSSNKDINTIITTGPPHSLHLIGLQLKNNNDINWLADFRDPWTSIHYHKSLRLSKRNQIKHKELEKQVLQTADVITVTSPSTKDEFQMITKSPIHLITNGYDDESISKISLDEKFSLVHIGSLLSNRNPKILWESIHELVNEHDDFRKNLKIQLVGSVSESVLESVQQYGLNEYLRLEGYVSHKQAIEFMNAAQVLLLIEMDTEETKLILPGKLYEYLSVKRPILSFGPEGSDIEYILQKTNGGLFFTYREKEALKATLLSYFEKFKMGNLTINSKGIGQFHRKELTSKYTTLLKNLP